MKFSVDKGNVKMLGRSMKANDIQYLDYSGSYVEFEFCGKWANATLWSDNNFTDDPLKAWVAVYINDSQVPYKRFSLESGLKTYELYSSLTEEKVKLRLVKMSEAAFAKFGIESIEIDGDKLSIPTAYKDRRIEFIGDSITCGYGNEGVYEVDIFRTAQENPMDAYAILTAEQLNADYHLVSWSGIGIISNYVEETIDEPLDNWLMPMLYQYTDASLSDVLGFEHREVWDYAKYIPDVIVINLGTNDASYTRGHKERINQFGKKYFEFLEYVRIHNKESEIICTLGAMGQDLCEEIEKQVNKYANDYKDSKIHYMTFDVQLDEDGIGTDWHPSKKTHKKMADKLTSYVAEIMKWN